MSSIGTFPKRNRNNEPLMSLKELAKEFNIKPYALKAYLQHYNGPKNEIVSKDAITTKTYFKPTEVRAWWKQIKLKT